MHPFFHASVICASVHNAIILLNHWEEFNQTCNITSPCGDIECVREQHYFTVHSVHLLSVHVTLSPPKSPWAEFNKTCYVTSPHGNGKQKQHYFLRVHHPPLNCLSGYLLLNYWAEFIQTCYMTSLMVSVCKSVCLLVMLLATLATSVGICNSVPSTAHSSVLFYLNYFFIILGVCRATMY